MLADILFLILIRQREVEAIVFANRRTKKRLIYRWNKFLFWLNIINSHRTLEQYLWKGNHKK